MFKKAIAAVLAVLAMAFGFTQQALAALPAGIDTAITGAGTDGSTLLGYMAAMGAALFVLVKVLRKFGILP